MSFESGSYQAVNVDMGSTQENGQPPPCLLDGKHKRLHDRLKNINVAMTWIQGELVSDGGASLPRTLGCVSGAHEAVAKCLAPGAVDHGRVFVQYLGFESVAPTSK